MSRVLEVAIKLEDIRVFERFHDLDFANELFFRTRFGLQSTLLDLLHSHEQVRFVSQLNFDDGTVSPFTDDLHRQEVRHFGRSVQHRERFLGQPERLFI